MINNFEGMLYMYHLLRNSLMNMIHMRYCLNILRSFVGCMGCIGGLCLLIGNSLACIMCIGCWSLLRNRKNNMGHCRLGIECHLGSRREHSLCNYLVMNIICNNMGMVDICHKELLGNNQIDSSYKD